MRGKIFFTVALCIFLTGILCGCVEENKKVGFSRDNPASIETPVTATFNPEILFFDIESGKAKAEVTVLQVLRGKQALNKLNNEAPMFDYSTESGYEKLLILIQFKYLESDKDTRITPNYYFNAFSSDGKELQSWMVMFEPNLNIEIYPGATHMGWIQYDVLVDDEQPFLVFDEEAFFKLYSN